jgi:hypothetical protein
LDEFKEQYNNIYENKFNASYCEDKVPVLIIEENKEAMFLDFDAENGYILIADNFEVFEFETNGEISNLDNLDYAYYSIYDGFGYYEENNFIPYKNYTENDLEKMDGNLGYAGQFYHGEAYIYNAEAYVKDRYYKNYAFSVYQENSLSQFEYVDQFDLSLFLIRKDDRIYSEGNCALSSIYAIFNYLSNLDGFESIPTHTVTYDITTDALYNRAISEGYIINHENEFPQLYLDIRTIAMQRYGYLFGGTSGGDISSMIEDVASFYNLNVDATRRTIFKNFNRDIIDQIDAGMPTIWNVGAISIFSLPIISNSYGGGHSTVATGYKIYKGSVKVLWFKVTKYVKLLQLNDNHFAQRTYFDYSARSNILLDFFNVINA